MKILYLRDSEELYSHSNGLCYATEASAGLDLRACWELDQQAGQPDSITIAAGARHAIPTGICMEIMQAGIAGFVYSRSGLGAKHGLTMAQGVGVIDADYRGELIVWLLNTSNEERTVHRGDRIAQLVLQPVYHACVEAVDSLSDTARGAGGFGHTGKV
ncbi:MAG: dUTP diphosphatase [Pseudomonadota bacterium]